MRAPLVALGIGLAFAGAACGTPCQTIAAERRALLQPRPPAPAVAHARVQVPYALANQVIAEVLATPPEVPVRLRRLGPLQPFIGDVRAVPRQVVVGPAAPGKVRFDVRVELRDRSGELLTLIARAEVTPALERRAGDFELSIGLGAEQVLRFEPELGPRAAERLGGLLTGRLPALVRARIPQQAVDTVAAAIIEEVVQHGYTLLRRPLLRRLGELTRIRVRLPAVPIDHVVIGSIERPAPALDVALMTRLPVRAGLGPPAAADADAISVQVSGSTAAELANWGLDHGYLPPRYTRKLKPDPRGRFVPRLDWRPGDRRRPLVVHLFQVEGGCAHFQVGLAVKLEVRDGKVAATVMNRHLEKAQGPPLVKLAGFLKRLVERSVERTRRAAAHTRVTIGGRALDTRLTRAALVGDELRFGLQLSAGPQLASADPHANP